MSSIAESALPLVFGTFFLSLLAEWLLRWKTIAVLRQRHEEVWKGLGSPTLFWNANPKHGTTLPRFVWGREAQRLDDSRLTRLASAFRVVQVIEGALVLIGGILIVLLLTQS